MPPSVKDSNGGGMSNTKGASGRALVASPLLALLAVGLHALNTAEAVPFARVVLDQAKVASQTGDRVLILDTFYGILGLDSLVSLANVFFFPSLYGHDALSRAQVISFLSDGGVVLTLWWLESLRGQKRPWYLRYPAILTLIGQGVGLGVVCPLYAFLSFIQYSETTVLSTTDSSVAVLFPALLLGYYIPALGMFFWPNLVERQTWLFVWQLYPLHVALAFFALSSVTLGFSASGGGQRLKQLNRGLVSLRLTVGLPAVVSAATWVWTFYENRTVLARMFIPAGFPGRLLPDMTAFCGEFLRWDELLVMLSMLSWLVLICVETWRAHLSPWQWARKAALGLVLLIMGGPGALLAVTWQRREEMLTKRWERELLLEEVAAKVDGLLRANSA